MSWLKKNYLKNNIIKQYTQNLLEVPADRSACYDSFRKHWQQAYEIIKQPFLSGESTHDFILAFSNHVDQMMTLLSIEFRNNMTTNLFCLEYLLSENLLDIIYDWSLLNESSHNVARLKLIKLFELLISHNWSLIVHEPVLRPLLKLLKICHNVFLPHDTELELIALLKTICVALSENPTYIDLFFHSSSDDEKRKFLVFSLLLPFIYREGIIGQETRDAIILCTALSTKNYDIAIYLSENSNFCPILATGISGLYSLLPRKLDIQTDNWRRLTKADISNIPTLSHLIQYLEFCNAIAQVSHSSLQKKLFEYLYQGFFVPVLGPAILQTSLDDAISSTCYLELFLRKITNSGFLYTIIRFLLEPNYDGCRLLDALIQRISLKSKLCIVTLSLFETLVELNSEDIMLELCLLPLLPCSHVMLSQRCKLRDYDLFGNTARKIMSLRPGCCLSWMHSVNNIVHHGNHNLHNNSIKNNLNSSLISSFRSTTDKPTLGNLDQYFEYLHEARHKIILCEKGCFEWSSKYGGVRRKKDNSHRPKNKLNYNEAINTNSSSYDTINNVKSIVDFNHSLFNNENRRIKFDNNLIKRKQTRSEDIESGLFHLLAVTTNDDHHKKQVENRVNEMENMFSKADIQQSRLELPKEDITNNIVHTQDGVKMQFSHYQSDQSGLLADQTLYNYEENINSHVNANHINQEAIFQSGMNADKRPTVGAFLDAVLRKLECMTSNNLYVNLCLTGLISRLAIYQHPLLQSFLLNPSLIFQPSIRSLLQILATLKNKIDRYLSQVDNIEDLLNDAHLFFNRREFLYAKEDILETYLPTNRTIEEAEEIHHQKRRSLTTQLSEIFKIGTHNILHRGRSYHTMYLNEQTCRQDDSSTKSMLASITPTQQVVLCAIILDEWLKELSAIMQEHYILSLAL